MCSSFHVCKNIYRLICAFTGYFLPFSYIKEANLEDILIFQRSFLAYKPCGMTAKSKTSGLAVPLFVG